MSFVSKVVFYNNQLHQISVFEIDCVHLAEFFTKSFICFNCKKKETRGETDGKMRSLIKN